jgi:hypothetical protein
VTVTQTGIGAGQAQDVVLGVDGLLGGIGGTSFSQTASMKIWNVLRYGADPTNARDSTAAIQAAQADQYANGGFVYFPTGTYGTTGLTYQGTGANGAPCDRWIGDGKSRSIIVYTGTAGGTLITAATPTSATFECSFDGLAFNGNNRAALGFDGPTVRNFVFTRCDFGYCTTAAERLYGQRTAAGAIDATHPGDTTFCSHYGCTWHGPGGSTPLWLTGTAGSSRLNSGQCNQNLFVRPYFFGDASAAVTNCAQIDYGTQNGFILPSFQAGASGQNGIKIAWFGNALFQAVCETNPGIGISFTTDGECHDNFVFGLHDGGGNGTLFSDPNKLNHIFGVTGTGSSGVAAGLLQMATGSKVMLPGLPTADPHSVGQVWSNAGVLTVSAG